MSRIRGLRSDLVDPAIDAHHGRVVKRTGDGSLIEFRSVVDAVRCAIPRCRTASPSPAFGDAAGTLHRVPRRHPCWATSSRRPTAILWATASPSPLGWKGCCEPGAICLSEQAYWQVKGRLDLAVTDLGPTQLKNITEPVRVYSLEVGKPAQVRATRPAAPKQRSMFMLLVDLPSNPRLSRFG